LHKYRSTFASWALWAGVDLRTAQQWLGHSDIESTMRYLKPSRSKRRRAASALGFTEQITLRTALSNEGGVAAL